MCSMSSMSIVSPVQDSWTESPKVLIVDDDDSLRATLSEVVAIEGYIPVSVATGQDALDRAQEEMPAVALIDLRLEDMSGLDVIRALKWRSPLIECILLTGYASRDSAIEAVNLGAHGYVLKPCNAQELLVAIRKAVEKRWMEDALKRYRDHLEDLVTERTVELRAANESLKRENAERRRAEGELLESEGRYRQLAQELAAANGELETFAYSVSHDLRAPLRSAEGFSHALLEDYGDKLDGQGKEYVGRVRAATQRMASLIDDLLNLSRITRREMKREDVHLSAMAETIAAGLRRVEPERQVEFIVAKGVVVKGDSGLLRVVLENLLGNAWKFTSKRSHARIEFGTVQQGEERIYLVRDNGVGFDMAYAERLFGPFQRLHGPDEFPGTGIGLATVQRVVQRHGGRVWAEGEVDRGATLYFTLGV